MCAALSLSLEEKDEVLAAVSVLAPSPIAATSTFDFQALGSNITSLFK
jgi:hypothetical protein